MRRPPGAQVRGRAFRAAWIAILLSCGGESLQGPDPEGQPQEGLILSEPQVTPEGSIAFASLSSGAALGGLAARITNLAADTTVRIPMFDGGFDPVAIPGDDGDTIRVDVEGGSGQGPSFVDVLKRGKPPVVVRAGPTRGAMDVSLNASIVVVWSTPMRPETINPTTITVVLGGDTVPATVQLSGDRLRAEVKPTDLLPSREYTLVVSGEVASNTGKPMATEYRTVFRTVVLPTVTRVTLSAESDTVELGQPAQLAAAVLDSAGNPLEGRRIVWSSSGGATVSQAGLAVLRSPGPATFTASVEGITATRTLIANPLRFREVAAGDHYTCGVTAAGFGYCWGRNAERQLGAGLTDSALEPAAVLGGIRFQTIAAGGGATCAIALDGLGYCWGATGWNDLSPLSARPVALWSPFTYSAMSLGNHRMCAVDGDGATVCSGHHYLPRRLDWDETDVDSWYSGPFPYFTEYPLRSLAVGDGHTCGLSDSGVATCWGLNFVGQLGDGTTTTRDDVVQTDRFEPALTQVDTDVPFVSITAGFNHTCALDAAGRAYCWGDNRNGELGSSLTGDCGGWNLEGTAPSCRARPVPVSTSLVFRSLTAGKSFTCGVTADGQAYCWGLGNEGQLGTGSRASTKSVGPALVAGGLRFETLSAGTNHACGLTVEGRAYCWGGGTEGQLGTGFVTDRLTPVEVKLQGIP